MTVQFDEFRGDISGPATSAVSGGGDVGKGFYSQIFKRVFDTACVLIVLPVILPATIVLLAIVALDGGSPLYRSYRVGRGGRIFGMLKIRTMVKDAPAQLSKVLATDPAARAEWDETQKLKCDPRITRLGRILRKTSLDELPQLWNVLTGDMSLVGPRPMLPEQRDLYPGRAYFELRPGLTGPWQVSDRNNSKFSKRAEYDSRYYQTLSLTGDLRILVQTITVVFRGTGY